MISNVKTKSWKTSILLSWFFIAVHQRHRKPAKRRVCVIGAGVAGLISAKHLSKYPDEFEVTVFEKQADVGGMWIYSDPDECGLPVHSSVYKNVRINAPKELLASPDFPQFGGGSRSFVTQSDVLQYLKDYAEHFSLHQYIQFNSVVDKVRSLPDLKWLVDTRNLRTEERIQLVFDAIVVGNGHHVKENIPKIPGLESFPGRILHSHVYREPNEFSGQTVVVLGASFSGIDIGIEISKFAKTVYLSHKREKLPSKLPDNMVQIPAVTSNEGSDLVLSDHSRIKAHAFVLCTGYLYDFPFLDESSGIDVEDGRYVRPLYKHLINVERPTMAILNLPDPGFPLVMPHAQIQYFIAILLGRAKLPSREEMLKDSRFPEGKSKSKAHRLLEEFFAYYDELAVAGGGEPLPAYFEPAFWHIYPQFFSDPMHYRDKNLYIRDEEHFEFF